MRHNIVIKGEARQDMLDTYIYYETQQAGLGERFLQQVQERFTDLELHPEYYSYVDEKQVLRDITIDVFPYVIIYRIVETDVLVYAVIHTRKRAQ